MVDCVNATIRSAPVFSAYRSYHHQSTASHQLWPFESSIFWPACALCASFQFQFCAALLRALFVLSLPPFRLSRSFFASKFFARGRTFNFFPSILFYCLPGLFVSYNRLLQLFIYRRTLSLTFCLFQRGCTFTHLSNFYSPKRTEPRSRARERAYF
jgi:hypothetical protein